MVKMEAILLLYQVVESQLPTVPLTLYISPKLMQEVNSRMEVALCKEYQSLMDMDNIIQVSCR